MIPKNDAPTSRQLPANAGVIALRMHVLGTCQAVGWCTCANCCQVRYNRHIERN